MCRKRPFYLLAAIILLMLAFIPAGPEQHALAQTGGDPKGEPKQFGPGKAAMYAVWHSANGWHLRTTTAKKQHHFKGKIETPDGIITKVSTHKLEVVGPNHDIWKLGLGGGSITFDFKNDRDVDGIDFQVAKLTKFIRFNLLLDGRHQPERIFLGHTGHHPFLDPFTLTANPI